MSNAPEVVPDVLPSGIKRECDPAGVWGYRERCSPGSGVPHLVFFSFSSFFCFLGVPRRNYGYFSAYGKAKAKLDEVVALRDE